MASGGIPSFDDYKPKAITVTGKVPNFDDYSPEHPDRSVRDHLKDEGFLDSVWNVVKSPVSIVQSLLSGEYAKEGTAQRKRADELQQSGTPEQKRQFAKEIILQNIPGASTVYKATHGNVAGAAGDVAGMVVLGGLIKGVQKTADAGGTIRRVVTDPEVVKTTRAAIPEKYRKVWNTAEAVKNRIAAERAGPPEQPRGGHFQYEPAEATPPADAQQPRGGHFPYQPAEAPPPAPAPAAPPEPAPAAARPPAPPAETSPMSRNATAADIAAQMEESMRPDTLTDFIVRNKIPPEMVANFGETEWRIIADQARVRPPTPENIAAIRANLEPKIPEAWRDTPPPKEAGPPAPTASELRVDALAQKLAAEADLSLSDLASLPDKPDALRFLDALGRSLKIEGAVAPSEIPQIIDRVRQLRSAKPTR
jgi:hypothetical protein